MLLDVSDKKNNNKKKNKLQTQLLTLWNSVCQYFI